MNTYGDIGNATAGWLFTRLLSRAITVQVLEMFAMQATLPPNQTKVAQFQRLVPFPAATTPLTEGVPPDPDEVTYETISVIVQRFGGWAKISDVVDDHSKQNVLGHIVDLQGDQVALTRELIHWDTMRSGTNVAYGGNATSRAALEKGDVLTAATLDAIDRLLSSLKAKHITEILSPGLNYETYSVDAGYVGVTHTDLKTTLKGLSGAAGATRDGFTKTADYGTREAVSPHEYGTYSEVRMLVSPELKPWRGAGADIAAGAAELTSFQNSKKPTDATKNAYDVYPLVVFGQEAYGGIALRGRNAIMPFVKNPNHSTTGDPLGQVGYAAWKMPAFATLILNQSWMRRVEVPVAR